jgi:threonine synthase
MTDMTSYYLNTICLECGHEMAADINLTACSKCGSNWLDARYDYPAVTKIWAAELSKRERSLWRYAELLPLTEPDVEITMGEGYTSLTRLYAYERLYQHEHIYLKDERQGPTSSFKDRQAALSVMAMRRAGITECVLASTGNAGAAYAAYCARAGIKLWLFLTSLVSSEKMREAALYGAEVVKVSGTYDETKDVAAEFAKRKGIHYDRGAKAVPGKESMKTLAFEIAEQLGLKLDGVGHWRSPDWYIQAVSGGIGPLGVWKGFSELHEMGLIDKMPRLGIIQAAGCAPMVEAFKAGREKADPVIPKTLITVLATGDPGFSYVLLRKAALSNGGVMMAVEDGKTFEAMRRLASKAGFSVEPATAVAFAGLEEMLSNGTIKKGEVVVVNCSGHTFTAESHILGDRYVLDLELRQQSAQGGSTREEGLDAAIRVLDEQVTSILIVDDNPVDRRLVRRLLKGYKNYRILEAGNGVEALKIVQDRKPDLIIADLTMPEMDGFALLEKLKADAKSADIPIVVVSAKNLSIDESKTLKEYTDTVWTKGGFDTRQLVEHVASALGHTLTNVLEPREPQAVKSAAPLRETKVNNHISSPLVVIIEDNPQDMRLARRLLESDGDFRIIEATTGREGLKAIYEHHPELVILDLMLPEMDGMSVLEALQNDKQLRDTPVIVLSAKELTLEEKESLRPQISSLIQKASLDGKSFLYIVRDILK